MKREEAKQALTKIKDALQITKEQRRRWWVKIKAKKYTDSKAHCKLLATFNKNAVGRFEAIPSPGLNSGMAIIEVRYTDDAEILAEVLRDLKYAFTVTDSEKEDWYKQFAIDTDEVTGYTHGFSSVLNRLCRACGLPLLIPFVPAREEK